MFPDPEAFEVLARLLLPSVLDGKGHEGVVRVWVPGCGAGEQAYAVAMLLLEHRPARASSPSLQVFATDAVALDGARAGIYPADALASMSPQRVRRFFRRHGDRWQVDDALRHVMVFATHDLGLDPPFANLDLVWLGARLDALSPVHRPRVLESFHFGLRRAGVLRLDPEEPEGPPASLFEPLSTRWGLHRRIEAPARGSLSPAWGSRTRDILDLRSRPPERKPLRGRGPTLVAPAPSPVDHGYGAEHVRQLEVALEDARIELHRTIEDFESSNDELLVLNEELEAANDELEASHEELRSLNDALRRSHEELEQRVAERTAEVERLRLQAELRQAHKLEALGRLVRHINHDFDNVLMGINGASEALVRSLPSEHPARPLADAIKREATRGFQLTRQLLTFSRTPPLEPAGVDVDAVVAPLQVMLERLAGSPAELRVGLGAAALDARPEPRPPASLATAGLPLGGDGGRVLLVEDHSLARDSCGVLLRSLGHEVLEAADAAQARAHASRERIDLLMCDVGLPDERGTTLARELQRERPGLAVLYVTGLDDREPEMVRALKAPHTRLLTKPVDIDELGRVIGRLLQDVRT